MSQLGLHFTLKWLAQREAVIEPRVNQGRPLQNESSTGAKILHLVILSCCPLWGGPHSLVPTCVMDSGCALVVRWRAPAGHAPKQGDEKMNTWKFLTLAVALVSLSAPLAAGSHNIAVGSGEGRSVRPRSCGRGSGNSSPTSTFSGGSSLSTNAPTTS
jgi:hypothetical protein